MKKLAFALMLALSSTLLASCHAANEKLGLDVVGYNHTDHDIGDFSVDGQGGAFLRRHKPSGFACCVSIPRQYSPGMTVTVTWIDEYGENPQSRVVAVPPYTSKDTGLFSVHFLRSGQIKVFVTSVGIISSPDYPLKGDEASNP